VTSDPRAFLALDLGTATSSASLVGRLDGRWRLLGSAAVPAVVPIEPAIARLVDAVRSADPALASELRLPDPDGEPDLPRLTARTSPTPRLAIVAATTRQLELLTGAAGGAGWRTVGSSADAVDQLGITALILERSVSAVLVGSGDPPWADERPRLADLARVVAAAAARRPELDVIVAGSMADQAGLFERPEESAGPAVGALLFGPAAALGSPAGEPLRALLERLRTAPDDGRSAIVRATQTLADVLDRRIETIDVGYDAGLRCVARPGAASATDGPGSAIVAAGALVPPDLDDEVVDGILGWSTVARDRPRLLDRLRDLRIAPWGDADGDGALLRMAAARAAVGRILAATPALEPGGAPDLVVASGGVWAVAPGPALTLALADVLRRSGASQYAYDHARLLGPLGTIEDDAERRLMLRDLADDLLLPLGSVVLAAGVRAGRDAGHLLVHGAGATSELDLVPGGLQLVDLPPGQIATAEIRFRDPVRLGARGRRFEVEVAGGLGGLLVDLRDIPLRFPERSERRRELLAAWQGALWTGIDE
jgi:hypothetical protein